MKRHCIETDIKKQYNSFLSQYFQSPEDTGSLEKKISLLKHALETLDFRKLRARHPALSGHTDQKVFLSSDDTTSLCIQIDTKQVYP